MTPEEKDKLEKELLNIQAELILEKYKPGLKELILERINFLNNEIQSARENKNMEYYKTVETCYLYYRLIETFY